MAWFKDGDRNTKFFHAQVNGRRKKLKLTRIKNGPGNWLEEEEEEIADEAVNFYKDQFCETATPTAFHIIDHVPCLVDREHNEKLITMPTKEEVKQAVFGLNDESVGGPDGFTGAFYQSCWEIIGDDIYAMVLDFFCGQQLPKCVTHTNLVLLPKKKEAGFVKGRSIVENVLLTQEIVTDIRLRTKAGPNAVIKLDMTKAYDRLSWLFLTKSSRGVKQGDPLSPTLFILAAEALSRGLNSLHLNLYFCGYGLPKWSPKINHLAYADDTIIFTLSDATSLRLVMEILQAYEVVSGSVGGNSRHWASWNNLCLPYEEGGIRFRSLHDVAKALFCKLWWNFRTKPSLWSSIISQKYCKKLNATVVPWKEGSHVWRRMLECRDIMEHQILWKPRMGSSLFWYYNWTGLGVLYFLVPQGFGIDEDIFNVHDVVENGAWNVERILQAAVAVWKYFLPRARIVLQDLTLHQAITKCWNTPVVPRIKPIMQALPACIVLELWKKRNSLKYGEAVSVNRVIYQVSTALQSLVQVQKPGLQVPHKWSNLLYMLEQYTPRLKYEKVLWELPMEGWIKVNTDGASRGNPGRSAIGFCLRDQAGDLKYAQGKEITEGSNNKAEAEAIVEALRICRAMNYNHIWLQTDSLLLKNIIEGSWKPPWCIMEQIEEIMKLKENFNNKVSHIFREGNSQIFREGNSLADHLGNYALDVGDIECFDFWDVDSKGRKIVNDDKYKGCTVDLCANRIPYGGINA
ncbi:PREDICTED: uncharacterized protein LOC109206828 [Nicotiana attenuata]|uniref:uncharacterized protein LOC109206828 n=1 Tax=Nicotiana attenuata TaxID=49451 RepID=UPI000905618C|nr:PREDICTED: uncharacterized protein LOC109206828 [Nicotiana attenuata]